MLLAGLPLLVMALLIAALMTWRSGYAGSTGVPPGGGSKWAGALGVNLEPAELVAPDLSERLARLAQANVTWVRFTIPWAAVEPARGQLDWAFADRVFTLFGSQPDLRPLVVLAGAPAWARRTEDAGNPAAPPQERADFGAFAWAVAERYGARVQYYQVWHEPNIAPHWGARGADPADYVGLLREAAIHLRTADADARIVLAALAPNIETGGANLNDPAFLDGVYESGGAPWFDVVAAEPYGFSAPPDAAAEAVSLNFGRAQLLHDVMARHGDAATHIWATAFGWNALPDDWAGAPSAWGQVDDATQAAYARQALELARTRWSWCGPLFWAAAAPPRPADDPWRGFALWRDDGAPRPVLAALSDETAQPAVLPAGNHALDHPALRFAPGWRVTPSAADSGAEGDTFTYDFVGTGTALYLQGGPYWAYYTVTVDDRAANALPRDESGASYLILYDPLSEVRLATLAQGLASGLHRVQIAAHGGWGQWALRGVHVTGAVAERSPLLLDWRLLFCVALGLSLAWLALARRELGMAARWLVVRIDALSAGPDAVWYGAAAALLLLLAFVPGLGPSLLALAGLGMLFLIRPDVALLFIAFVIPFWPRPKSLIGFEFSLYEMLVWAAAAAASARWLLEHWSGHRRRATEVAPTMGAMPSAVADRVLPAIRGLDWPVLALLVVGLAATLAAGRGDVAHREYRVIFLSGALFYALMTRVPWPRGRSFSPRPVIAGFLAGMTVISLVALWQYVTGEGRIDVEGVGRVRAFFGSPNNLALVLDRALPLVMALTLFGAWDRRDTLLRVLSGLAIGVMLLACVLTFSKGAILIGLPVGIATVLIGGAWRTRQRWPLWTLGIAATLGVAGMAVLAQTPRFADLANLSSGTGFFRIKLWQSAWQMFVDRPWLGVGPDNFLNAYRSHYVLPSAWQELNLSHPHNLLLDLGTRLGLFGLIAGVWAIGAGLAKGLRLVRQAEPQIWPRALGLVGGLLAALAHGMIDNSLFLIDLMGIFMLFLGLLQRSDAAMSDASGGTHSRRAAV